MAQPRTPATGASTTQSNPRRPQLPSSSNTSPVRRQSSSVQDILEAGRRRSEALVQTGTLSDTAHRGSTITLTQDEVQRLIDEEEFREWKREKERQQREQEMIEEQDERTSIIGRSAARTHSDYGTTNLNEPNTQASLRSRPSQRSQATTVRQSTDQQNGNGHTTDEQTNDELNVSFFGKIKATYGSLELENKGSVARDHLALERTFLAWLRTSLTFASIGIAITQLFRLNTSLANKSPPEDPTHLHMRSLGKPIGATFVAISIVVLFTGFHRYFESQHWILRGKFPASRGSIVLIASIAFLLMVASLIVVLVVEPRKFEK